MILILRNIYKMSVDHANIIRDLRRLCRSLTEAMTMTFARSFLSNKLD